MHANGSITIQSTWKFKKKFQKITYTPFKKVAHFITDSKILYVTSYQRKAQQAQPD